MKIPTIQGVIDRRMLVNFTAEPDIVKKILPAGFQPHLFKDKAIVGICLIRLKHIRPKGLPSFIGISSENGAHRIAVQWIENNQVEEGVYIARRDTSSWLNNLAGGRIFPGKHHYTIFNVQENEDHYHIDFKSSDGTPINVDADLTNKLDENSIFGNLETVSKFFQNGLVGYSPNGNKLDGLKLKAFNWLVKPLKVSNARSSFFENEKLFPKGTIKFDNALLMTEIAHEWDSVETKSNIR